VRLSFSIGPRIRSIFRRRNQDGQEEKNLEAVEQLDRQLVQQLSPSRLPSTGQLKFLGRILSRRETLLLRGISLIVIAGMLTLGIRFFQRHIVSQPSVGGTYSEALVGSPNRVNPLYAAANDVDRDLSALVYSRLFTQSATQGIQPELAESYSVSEDEKTYTVKIRSSAVWHDGQPLTVDDILFTFESIQNPEYQSPLSVNFRGVTINRVDDQTISFVLSEPFAPFIGTLTFGILPQHVWGDVPPLNVGLVEYNLKPIGSGPYRFDRLTRDRFGNVKTYELVRNEAALGRAPYLERLIFRFYPDFPTAVEAVHNKKVDGISYVPEESKIDLEHLRSLRLTPINLPQYTAIFYNQNRSATLKDHAVREALTRGTNIKELISKVLGNDGVQVNGPILSGMLGFNPEMKTYPYDVEQAKKLLDDAGWKIPEGETYRKKGDTPLVITVVTSRRPTYQNVLEQLTEQWAAIGVKLEASLIDPNRIQEDIIKPREYDALLYGEVVGYDPDPYPFWHSSQQKDPGLSLAIFYRKEADKALERARKVASLEERSLKYVEFQNLLAEEIPALFLYQPIYTYGLPKKVKGFPTTFIEVASDRFNDVEDWYISTHWTWN
jgi:peptide/nickel transport system substrate-binding protein